MTLTISKYPLQCGINRMEFVMAKKCVLLKITTESVNIKETGLRLQSLSIICIFIYRKLNE